MRVSSSSKGLLKAVNFTKAKVLTCLMLVALVGAIATPGYSASSSIDPSSLSFGTQTVGSGSAPKSVTYTNKSFRRVSIVNVSSSVSAFIYGGTSLPVTLNPGQSLTGTVIFMPASAQAYNGKLTFTTGSGWGSSIDISGTGIPVPVTPPSIVSQPAAKTIIAGQTATFSVTATGTGPLYYQWKKNGAAISNAFSSSYTTPAATVSDSGTQFTVTVTNAANNVTSNAAMLTVNAPSVAPSITTQPTAKTIIAGQTATFSVVASGTAPLSYQWKKNSIDIAGANAASYTTPAEAIADNAAQFSVRVSNSVSSILSSAAILTVNAPVVAPSITSQPVSQTVAQGQTATFFVAASGTAPLSYQWKKNNANIAGATSFSYTTPAGTMADNASQFTVTVSNTASSVNSNVATLTVNAAPGALTTSSSALNFGNVTVGGSGSLSTTLTNSGTTSITILGVSVSGAGFTPNGIPNGMIINGGGTATLNVVFAPAATGLVNGNVIITSTASNPTLTISVSATGAQAVTHKVTLNWGASTSSVAGYSVYRSAVSGGSYAKVTSSLVAGMQFVDSAVQSGQTYYYVVRAMDYNNVESIDSNQATAIVP